MILNKSEVHRTSDNIGLYVSRDIVEDSKAIILIVHGLAEHLGRYDYVVSKLNQCKYSVYRFDNRGHGKSGGERVFIDDYKKFYSDLNEVVKMIKSENKNKPIFILGHSMGGMISILYGIEYQNEINGIILSAALSSDESGFIKDNKKLNARDEVDNSLSEFICSNPAVVEEYNNDDLVAHKISGSMFVECNKAIEFIKKNSEKFNYPVLILHGANDQIVLPEDSKVLFDHIGSKYKKIKLYEGMYHEILNEYDKDEVLKDINNWIRKELRYIK